jgi:hypothetical protein
VWLARPRGPAEFNDFNAQNLGQAIAALPSDEAVAEALRIAVTGLAPEYQAEILLAVLEATGDPGVEAAAVATIDRFADPIQRASARIDMAPYLRDPAHLARLLDWAAVLGTDADRAFMLAAFAAATGLPDLAEKAVAGLPDIAGDVDRREFFVDIVAAVAAGPDPARVAVLMAAFPADERPTRDTAVVRAVADMTRQGQGALALTLVRAMTYDQRKATAIARIGAVSGDAALLAEALMMARDVVGDIYRPLVLNDIAQALMDAG